MSKLYVSALLLTLAAAPAAWAHVDGTVGVPKTYCEIGGAGDWDTHDYGPAAGPGLTITNLLDGNLEDCFPWEGDVGEFDGHYEFANGGAWIVAEAGDGSTHGSFACGLGWPDHEAYPDVIVEDAYPRLRVFWVAADAFDNVPDGDDRLCGDGESDVVMQCHHFCWIPFAPGLDGSYQVYVEGAAGHVWATPLPSGTDHDNARDTLPLSKLACDNSLRYCASYRDPLTS